jgi:hypothetical protein
VSRLYPRPHSESVAAGRKLDVAFCVALVSLILVGLDWLRPRAHSSNIVATTMPYWVYLRTGLRAVMPPADTDPEEVLRLLDAVPVRYVMAGGSTAIMWGERHVYPAVRGAPERWAPIYTSPAGDLVIYERRGVRDERPF